MDKRKKQRRREKKEKGNQIIPPSGSAVSMGSPSLVVPSRPCSESARSGLATIPVATSTGPRLVPAFGQRGVQQHRVCLCLPAPCLSSGAPSRRYSVRWRRNEGKGREAKMVKGRNEENKNKTTQPPKPGQVKVPRNLLLCGHSTTPARPRLLSHWRDPSLHPACAAPSGARQRPDMPCAGCS